MTRDECARKWLESCALDAAGEPYPGEVNTIDGLAGICANDFGGDNTEWIADAYAYADKKLAGN